MNLKNDLQGWEDSVGAKVSTQALAAQQAFDTAAEQLVLLTEQLNEKAKTRPKATEHPLPVHTAPPQSQEETTL